MARGVLHQHPPDWFAACKRAATLSQVTANRKTASRDEVVHAPDDQGGADAVAGAGDDDGLGHDVLLSNSMTPYASMSLSVKLALHAENDAVCYAEEAMTEQPAGLRERMRRTVLNEIAEVALKLFTERSYESVTIDDIAAAAGLSRRSVFRYFSTKEDIVVGKFDFVAGDMLAELRARPASEPPASVPRVTVDGYIRRMHTAQA